jgi:hypothetical protein
MRVQNPKKFRRLIAGRCRYCDRRFFYRHPGRPRTYCDHKCRQAEFRYSGYLRKPPKKFNRFKGLEGRSRRFGLTESNEPVDAVVGRHLADDLPIPPFLQRRRT